MIIYTEFTRTVADLRLDALIAAHIRLLLFLNGAADSWLHYLTHKYQPWSTDFKRILLRPSLRSPLLCRLIYDLCGRTSVFTRLR